MSDKMFDFDSLINIAKGDEFEETPVEIEEFIYGENYLNFNPNEIKISEYQMVLIRACTQIYKRDTLHNWLGLKRGEERWQETKREVIFQLGKGSGKDFSSTIACAYIVYLLLCLKDPSRYYGRPAGETIDLLNVAINATQANNVFFTQFKNRIINAPWFQGKYEMLAGRFSFDKNINVHSGHSEREAWEGYNFIYIVLDEIAGFAIDNASGNENAKTAELIYKAYRGAVTSRFAQYGKLVLLSFPRYKGDFIQQRYEKVIAQKETVIREHTFKIDPDLPDGTEGNEFKIEWEEDHIISYTTPSVFALKRPSWEVNPTKDIDIDYMESFYDDPLDALGRYACMPPDSIDGFFKEPERVEFAFGPSLNGIDDEGRFRPHLMPEPGKNYYVHVDLARKHDRAVVSMAHVDRFERRQIGKSLTEASPIIKVDSVRYWTPSRGANINFSDIREHIKDLRTRGFNIKLVTFDRWESDEMIEYLNGIGIPAEKLSVAKKHYQDLALAMNESRIVGPDIELLRKELLQLRIMPNDKVDHPRSGSKDLADSVCGAVFNCISHETRIEDEEVDIVTLSSFRAKNAQEIQTNRLEGKKMINPPSAGFQKQEQYDPFEISLV